jgi:hypothetical protein
MSIPSDFNLPDEYKFSEEIAVKKLRSYMVSYKIVGHAFTEWEDSSGRTAPTVAEVYDQLGMDMARAETWYQSQLNNQNP